MRTIISSLLVFFLVLALFNYVDPNRVFQFSVAELRLQIIEKAAWYGVIFGAIYTALYARFSSQWTYLANLYNSIKQAESSDGDNIKLSQWKAGFIEDAENLHMACKGSFVSVINAWANDQEVKTEYIQHTPGGENRFARLINNVEFSTKLVKKKYEDG